MVSTTPVSIVLTAKNKSLNQGILTEGECSVQLNSSIRKLFVKIEEPTYTSQYKEVKCTILKAFSETVIMY